MENYVYQPRERVADFESALEILRRSVANPVEEASITGTEEPVLEAIYQGLRRFGIPCEDYAIPEAEYLRYRERAQYPPMYYPVEIAEKALEHFLSLSLMKPGRSDVLIDLAAEASPFSGIASRLTGCRAYAQDIMYPAGIRDGRIGGDACEMPVPDGFASCACLTCSLEHFEGDADMRLFRELARVLRPGGRVVAVPLYLWNESMAVTDPTVSALANVPFDRDAKVYALRGWNNRHGRFYSPETLRSRLLSAASFRFTVWRLTDARRIPGVYARWVLLGERV